MTNRDDNTLRAPEYTAIPRAPTLADALAVPEVAALVEALQLIRDRPEYRLPSAKSIATAALAAMEGKEP